MGNEISRRAERISSGKRNDPAIATGTPSFTDKREDQSPLARADVESAKLVSSGVKAIDPVTDRSIAVILLPAVLLKIIDRAQAWIARGNGRTEKY